MSLLPTQEHKVNSAFRFANKQSDSLKMKQSLDQLLGSHSKKNTEDYDSPPRSTSTLNRRVTGPQNSSQDKNPGHTLGSSNTSIRSPNSSARSNPFFGHQLEFLANFTKTIDEIVLPKTSQSSPQLEKNFDFMATILSALNKQPVKCNFPFSREVLHDGTSNKQQQIFCSKLEQLRNLEERIAMAQVSENRFGSKKAVSQQNLTESTALKTESTRIEIPKRGYFQEISSLNSLDEEIDSSTKTGSSRLNNLSPSPTRQLDSIPSPINREVNLPMNFQKEDKMRYFSQTQPDFPDLSLLQRLESHHIKNLRSTFDSNGDLEGQCSSKAIPGAFSLDERINKILRYKKKIIKWRVAHPPNRNFSGRSAVAGSKPRIKGKFVKKEEYQKYIEIQKKNEMN